MKIARTGLDFCMFWERRRTITSVSVLYSDFLYGTFSTGRMSIAERSSSYAAARKRRKKFNGMKHFFLLSETTFFGLAGRFRTLCGIGAENLRFGRRGGRK